MRYPCPACRERLEIHRTFNHMIHVSCGSCGMADMLEYIKNPDEAYLEFLSRYDSGLLPGNAGNDARLDGLVRDEQEIREMIKEHGPAKITESILLSKKDYVSQFKVLRNQDPEMGCPVGDVGLDASLSDHLREMGVERFYKFQETAIRKIMDGQSIVIEAPTASGKTEAFLVPILHRLAGRGSRGGAGAAFVYPTKSLARDQVPRIRGMADAAGLSVDVFDGDMKQPDRMRILDDPPDILVTNFDVLHYHLWRRTRFASIISTIETLVADEVHVYVGIFGSNVHYILKRLRRICGNDIQFVAASAVLDDAESFCRMLFGTVLESVRGSGRKGEIDFAMLFPSLRTPRELMSDLTRRLTENRHKTMVFSNSHLGSELLAMHAKKRHVNIKVHRAGLMAGYRRSVESAFRAGRLDAISCTPTLELGIDIGNVDGVISSPVPANRLLQRMGRAARKGQRGFAFLVLGNDPISQYYKNHPDDYFEDVQRFYIDPRNPFVERTHVLAMACDRPFSRGEMPEHADAMAHHVREGNLHERNDMLVPDQRKASGVLGQYSIRGMGSSIDIFLNGRKAGDRMLPIALEELHKNAVYFLAGARYLVQKLEYPEVGRATLKKLSNDHPYYTRALSEEWPTIRTIHERRRVFGMEVAFCDLLIKKRVHGYANIELGQAGAGQGQKMALDTPLDYDFATKGIAFCAPRPDAVISKSENEEYAEASGYHATEHVLIEGSNMITGGASQDLGGISMGTSGLIFIYDGAIGGSGASKALYDRLEGALERSMLIVQECPCQSEAGCPRCTFSYRCGNNNEYLHKGSCLEVLRRINRGHITRIVQPAETDRPLV